MRLNPLPPVKQILASRKRSGTSEKAKSKGSRNSLLGLVRQANILSTRKRCRARGRTPTKRSLAGEAPPRTAHIYRSLRHRMEKHSMSPPKCSQRRQRHELVTSSAEADSFLCSAKYTRNSTPKLPSERSRLRACTQRLLTDRPFISANRRGESNQQP